MDDATRFADTIQQWPIFQSYGRGKVVCEIGVHFGGSSRAFLTAPCESLRSIELNPTPGVEDELRGIAQGAGVPWEFVVGDSMSVEPSACDVLFIDGWHTAKQLRGELVRYEPFVREIILAHDTGYWGGCGEDGGPGLIEAIDGFLLEAPQWRLKEVIDVFPGMTVLERVGGENAP